MSEKLPKAGRRAYDIGQAPPPPDEAPRYKPPKPLLLPAGPEYFVASVAALFAVVIMLGGAAVFTLNVLHAQSPSSVVPEQARLYLDALSTGDYAAAYPYITRAARVQFPLEEFRAHAESARWTWSTLAVDAMEPDAAVLSYEIRRPGQPPRRAGLIFIEDHGRWAVPYNLPALSRGRAHLERGEREVAVMRAEQAVQLDPRDPAAWQLLCDAERSLKLGEAARDCAVAQEMARRYPRR